MVLLAAHGAAVAAPKDGCPDGSSGWGRGSVDEVAAEIWAGLLDTSPWPGGVADLAAEIDGRYDRDDNGQICLATRWGSRPAEQAHWYGVTDLHRPGRQQRRLTTARCPEVAAAPR